MSEEKENILERNPFFKTRKLLRQNSKQNVKDNDLIQFIYHFIESERRKGVSLEQLKNDSSLDKVFEYVGDIDNSVLEVFEELSDKLFEISFSRCKRFIALGSLSSLQFIKYKFLHCVNETHIKFNGSLKFLPWDVLENENIYLHYCLYKNPDENLLNEEVRILLLKYSFKDRVIIDNEDNRCDYIIYADRDMAKVLRDVSFKAAEIRNDQSIIVIGDYIENSYNKDERLIQLIKSGKVSLVVKSDGFYSINNLVIEKHSDDIRVVSPIIVFHKDEARFNLDEFIDNNSYVAKLSQVQNIDSLDDLLSPHKILSLNFEKKKTIKLGSIASFSYGYAEGYQFEENDDPLAFVAERSDFDEKGGIKSFGDINKWHHVPNSIYHASLLKNNDIYITRKSSAFRIGIFDENTFYHCAPRNLKHERKLSAYVFGSSIIVRVNSDFPVYYVMAYLYNNVNKLNTICSKNYFFTAEPVKNFDIPILTQSEMQQIADEFKESYLKYLSRINKRHDVVLELDKITKDIK